MGKDKLKYSTKEDLAFDTYMALNGTMGEFHAIRMLYKHINKDMSYSQQEVFYMKATCWSQFASLAYRLWELSLLALPSFDFVSNELMQFIRFADDDKLTRLRQIFHHIKDRNTDKMFESNDSNRLMDEIFNKYEEYLTGQKSLDFMNLLGAEKDKFEMHFPSFKKRFEDFGKSLYLPRL